MLECDWVIVYVVKCVVWIGGVVILLFIIVWGDF